MILETRSARHNGHDVVQWQMQNASGASVAFMGFGATLLSVKVPDRTGQLDDVSFGHPCLADYWSGRHFLGAVVGRFANRLAGGHFAIDGRDYQLDRNDEPNALHGGPDGFDRRLWAGAVVDTPDGEGLCLTLRSADGDQGYPGTLEASVTCVWTADNRLITDFAATSDEPSPINLLLHAYWNLAPEQGGSGDHRLEIAADAYLPVDRGGIPTGELRPVAATPFDFRQPRRLADVLRTLQADSGATGYDHCWVIAGTGLRRAAILSHPGSGRTLTIETDRPGLQLYTANHFDAAIPARPGRTAAPHCAVALETQAFPDAPNQPLFPDAIVRPGTTWRSRTVYCFGLSDPDPGVAQAIAPGPT